MLNMIAGVAFNNDGAWLGLVVAFFTFYAGALLLFEHFQKTAVYV